jgi:hypothetical protein
MIPGIGSRYYGNEGELSTVVSAEALPDTQIPV